ncbi:hypothetical protein QUF64_16040 [Anaerolineales bacterium HSG6]|nr:hypothetical protein [Anaerolineales bacterium HSG6]
MTSDINIREQRLRKQAELQSMHINLASLRKQEASYISASALVPEILVNQINEVRNEIKKVERDLLALQPNLEDETARKLYWDAFDAELANDFKQANKLYRNASRYNYPDAEAAIQSTRHALKAVKVGNTATIWSYTPVASERKGVVIGFVILLMVLLVGLLVISFSNRILTAKPPDTIAEVIISTATPTSITIIQIIPDTATPLPTPTMTATPLDTATATPTDSPIVIVATEPVATDTPTSTPTRSLRNSPKIIGPRDGLVWGDGAIVFEFEDLELADDELYCLIDLKGFDKRDTENWSYPTIGSKRSYIPVDAHIFRIAKTQGIRCITWKANIGKNSCANVISQDTEVRVIGMPQPCAHLKTE